MYGLSQLNSYEFDYALVALDLDTPKSEYVKILEEYGEIPLNWRGSHSYPVNRRLVYAEKLTLCAARLIAKRDPREEATKTFHVFDYNKDSIISLEDIKQLAGAIGASRRKGKKYDTISRL